MVGSAEAASGRSTGGWLFQLTTITIGVLIALSFDAVLRWNSDRMLVAEAKTTIAHEIAENRGHVDGHLQALPRQVAQIDLALTLMDDLLAERESDVRELKVGLSLPELTNAGWETAERTGALALMDYPDVQRLANLYGFQELFVAEMLRMFEPLAQIQVYFKDGPPTTRDDLLVARSRIMDLRGSLLLHEQLGRQLSAAYAEYQGDHAAWASSP